MNSKKEVLQKTGIVIEALPNAHFKIKIDGEEKEIMAHLAGKMKMYRIRVLPGDAVTVEMNSLNDNRGRIIYRKK